MQQLELNLIVVEASSKYKFERVAKTNLPIETQLKTRTTKVLETQGLHVLETLFS